MAGAAKKQFTVLVCGGGNAAQVATAMFSAIADTFAVSLYADEAAKWAAALGDDEYELTMDNGKVIKSRPMGITNDPSIAAEADAIVLAVPSFAHGQYFEAFEPYIKKGCVVACMPARSGGDLLLAAKLGSKAEDVIFVGFETLPWACRFTEWGRKATVLGTKGSILAAVTPPDKKEEAFSVMQGLLGVFPNVLCSPNNLGISLRNPGAQIHPGVMYGRWCPEMWDGAALDAKPLFYQGVDEFTEEVLLGLTNEIQAVKNRLEELVPGLNLGDACTLHQWFLDSYGGQMADDTTLKGCMNTNPAYRGLTHPCIETDGKFMPDLKYRYLSEDVPTGMCFNKGLGEILGVPMPMTEKVLAWAQDCIGMSIMVDGRMCGPDVAKTRAPQATGVHDIETFLQTSKIDRAAVAREARQEKVGKEPRKAPAESEEKHAFTALVCGAGDAAQVAAALFAARYPTVALSLQADEAARWKAALGDDEFELTLESGKTLRSKPKDITSDPSVAAKADCIVLAAPPATHAAYYEALAPYMQKGCLVVAMPASVGSDTLFASKLGAKAEDMIFTAFASSPWSCQHSEWGRRATISSTEPRAFAAVTPPEKFSEAFYVMQGCFGVRPRVTESPHMLGSGVLRAAKPVVVQNGQPLAGQPRVVVVRARPSYTAPAPAPVASYGAPVASYRGAVPAYTLGSQLAMDWSASGVPVSSRAYVAGGSAAAPVLGGSAAVPVGSYAVGQVLRPAAPAVVVASAAAVAPAAAAVTSAAAVLAPAAAPAPESKAERSSKKKGSKKRASLKAKKQSKGWCC